MSLADATAIGEVLAALADRLNACDAGAAI